MLLKPAACFGGVGSSKPVFPLIEIYGAALLVGGSTVRVNPYRGLKLLGGYRPVAVNVLVEDAA